VVPPVTGQIVDSLGFLTGIVLYAMLLVMVWRERAGEGKPFLASRSRLPLLTGVAGLVWNVGALLFFGGRFIGSLSSTPALVAIAFSALGCLPAIVVYALLQGRETVAGRTATTAVITSAYALSGTAAVLNVIAALDGRVVPSRLALWVLTAGFTGLTALLLLLTRSQPIGRRGIWVAALAIFSVSALHFGRHEGNETWWVELLGHHASLPLALAILHQDYRFALADLFLKNAIALLMLMALVLALFSGVIEPLLRWQDPSGAWDPRAIAAFMGMWVLTALTFPGLRRLSNRLVDRVVLRRPDFVVLLHHVASALQVAESEDDALTAADETITSAFGVSSGHPVSDPLPASDPRIVVSGIEARTLAADASVAVVLRLRTVDEPHPALAFGPLPAGRRILSDDLRLLEAIAQLVARRIESLRVAQERLDRNLREQRMQRLATEAELRALRAQLNPHFLFNALTAIGYLIQTAPHRAVETLLRLTEVLRGVLQRTSTEFTSLAEEVSLVRAYLEIEQARFEERLTVDIDVPESVGPFAIPALLLQPLVENAVKHGLAPKPNGGTIVLRARFEAGRLLLTVKDTGLGFDSRRPRLVGVGLASVEQRLKAHYPSNARFDVQSSLDVGTTVSVDLPAEPWTTRAPQHTSRRRIG
jgi:two-component system, LytTR family, sensor kinase